MVNLVKSYQQELEGYQESCAVIILRTGVAAIEHELRD